MIYKKINLTWLIKNSSLDGGQWLFDGLWVPVLLLELVYNRESKSDQLILLLKMVMKGLIQVGSLYFRKSSNSLLLQDILFHGAI